MSAALEVRPPAGCGPGCSCLEQRYDALRGVHVFSTGQWTTYETVDGSTFVRIYRDAQEGA